MTDQEIFEKLDETYKTEKGKKFISHLLRSFFPVGKGQYMWDTEGKKRLRCCITGVRLVGKGEIAGAMMKVSPAEFVEYLKIGLDVDNEEATPAEHPVRKHLPNGAVLGIECNKSDKYLCQQAYEQLYNFYATKILEGDGYMNWLARNMMAKAGIKSFKKKGFNVTKREENAVIKKINKPSSMSLGDLDALQQLKDKLENK